MTQPTRIQFRLAADEHEIYTEQFAQSLIGKTPRFNARAFEGGPIVADYGQVTVVAAEVVDDGKALLITYEGMQRPDSPIFMPGLFNCELDSGGGMSFRPIPATQPTMVTKTEERQQIIMAAYKHHVAHQHPRVPIGECVQPECRDAVHKANEIAAVLNDGGP